MSRQTAVPVRGKRLGISMILLCISLCACGASMTVTPQIERPADISVFALKGKIIYDSDANKEYLPRTIVRDHEPDGGLTIKYEYNVAYGKRDIPGVIALYNPLTILGFPIGDSSLVVAGKLDILKAKEVVKSYEAICGFEKTRSLFSEGETFSELRKKGLFEVRDNIESQMYQDRNFLSKLANDSANIKNEGDHNDK